MQIMTVQTTTYTNPLPPCRFKLNGVIFPQISHDIVRYNPSNLFAYARLA